MKVTMSVAATRRVMLQTPRWDFGWQRQYLYDAESTVSRGVPRRRDRGAVRRTTTC